MKMNRQALAHVLRKFLVGDINVEKSRSRVVVPFQILICDSSKSSCHDWNEVLIRSRYRSDLNSFQNRSKLHGFVIIRFSNNITGDTRMAAIRAM